MIKTIGYIKIKDSNTVLAHRADVYKNGQYFDHYRISKLKIGNVDKFRGLPVSVINASL